MRSFGKQAAFDEIAALRAENERLKGGNTILQNSLDSLADVSDGQQARIAELMAALRDVRDAAERHKEFKYNPRWTPAEDETAGLLLDTIDHAAAVLKGEGDG